MKEIFIKHNPYKLITEIKINGCPLKRNSKLHFGEKRLQEWIDDLPDILLEECNTQDFKIVFKGTALDYEDVQTVASIAKKKNISIKTEHIPALEPKDKEQAVQEIFERIQKGPFEELKTANIIHAFESAKSSNFEVSVVATMSAGKSTLINSLLGQKLMPAKQEACTATITEIRDNNSEYFSANAYDSNGDLVKKYDKLTYPLMKKLNSNPKVSRIITEGNIPFLTNEEISLVLFDTPGPNNSRDAEHKVTTYRMLSKSSKAVVLYIMNATQLAVEDDNRLLDYVAESMSVEGRKSRDRFIFVVNKLDEFKKGEDSIPEALKKVKEYLADKGIENPNIYPASALTALNIRTILAENDDDNNDDVYEAKGKVRKFIRNGEMHFEKYAPLPASVKQRIEERLAEAIEKKDENEQALIHSGIISIEEAIRMYVQKYAKTAKIKNIVDTFITSVESTQSFELIKQQISQNDEHKQEIAKEIEEIQSKLNSGNEAKKFIEDIQNINYDTEINSAGLSIIEEAQKKITKYLNSPNDKLSRIEAEKICEDFSDFADELQAEVRVKLEDLVEDNVKEKIKNLFSIYKEKLSNLKSDVNVSDVNIEPFKIISGEFTANVADIIEDSTRTEIVKTGTKWIPNKKKKWYKPWTWFAESGHYEDILEDKDYIDRTLLAQKFFTPIQERLYDNNDAACEYAKEQVGKIKQDFQEKCKELDEVLKSKLEELKSCATDESVAEKNIKESREKLIWLEDVQSRIKEILDI